VPFVPGLSPPFDGTKSHTSASPQTQSSGHTHVDAHEPPLPHSPQLLAHTSPKPTICADRLDKYNQCLLTVHCLVLGNGTDMTIKTCHAGRDWNSYWHPAHQSHLGDLLICCLSSELPEGFRNLPPPIGLSPSLAASKPEGTYTLMAKGRTPQNSWYVAFYKKCHKDQFQRGSWEPRFHIYPEKHAA
jgi:hypothetical protein